MRIHELSRDTTEHLIFALSNHSSKPNSPHGSTITVRRYLDGVHLIPATSARLSPSLSEVLFASPSLSSVVPFFVFVTPRCPVTVGCLHVSINTLTAGNCEVSRCVTRGIHAGRCTAQPRFRAQRMYPSFRAHAQAHGTKARMSRCA